MTYSSSLAVGRKQVFAGRNQNATVLGKLLLGLLYLTQVTKTNAYGYQIGSLQKEQATLKAEHDDLRVASARLQAVERIRASEQANGLVSVAPAATLKQ